MSQGFAALHADAHAVLAAWEHPEPGQQAMRDGYLAFLEEHDDAMSRTCRTGHLTASALVIDASRRNVLLTLHPKAGRWLQLGGHCEDGDGTLRAAARREAIEEGGIPDIVLSDRPIRLDRHPVRCSGGHSEHLDVQYLATVPDGAIPVISHESDDLRWFAVDALPDDDATVTALVASALA